MKQVIRIFLIVYLFFVTLNANAIGVKSVDIQSQINIIQTESSQTLYIEGKSTAAKYIIPANQNDASVIFASQKEDNNSNFSNFKNGISPGNHQFSLLLTYIYNKSGLNYKNTNNYNYPQTEISPNAP